MLVGVQEAVSAAINLFVIPSLAKGFHAKKIFLLNIFYTIITAVIPLLVFSPLSISLS